MTCATHFGRDSPGSKDIIVDEEYVNNNYFNRYKMNAPFKNNNRGESRSEDIFDNTFSSMSELDAELKSNVGPEHRKSDSDHNNMDDSGTCDEELKIMQYLIDHPKIREQPLKSPECTFGRRGKSRTKKAKRGDSLEREIAKLILKQGTQDLNLDTDSGGELSPNDILSDLVESCLGTSSPSSQLRELSTTVINKDHEFVGKTQYLSENNNDKASGFDNSTVLRRGEKGRFEILSLGDANSKASDSDIFNFSKGDDEWAAFDDCPKFSIPLLPMEELDKNGFPILCRASSNGNCKGKASEGDLEWNENLSASEPAAESGQSDLFRDEKSVLSESSTNSFYLSGSSTGSSCTNLESPKSPSSVTDFGQKEGNNHGFKSTGATNSITYSKSVWDPKPPKHYNYSNGVE